MVVRDDRLAFRAEDEVDERFGRFGDFRLGDDVERAGDFVGAGLHVVNGRIRAVDLEGFHGVVQGTEGDVTDGRIVARNGLETTEVLLTISASRVV